MESFISAGLESQLNQLTADLDDTTAFIRRHQMALSGSQFNRHDVAAMEMLAEAPELQAGNEDFKTFAVNASRAIGQKLGKIGESIAIFFDTTGKKELTRLRRDVEAITASEPRRNSISSRPLTNAFTIGTRVIPDAAREQERVIEFINALTDDYVPAVLERDKRLWAVMDRTGYLRNGDQEALLIMIDDLMAALAKERPSYLDKLPDDGLSMFMGNRRLFVEIPPMNFRLDRNAQDANTLKVHKAYTSITTGGAGVNAARNVSAQAHNDVMPTLTVDGLRQHLEIIHQYTVLLERVTAIYRGTRGMRIMSEIQTVLASAEELEEYDVTDSEGSITETVVTSNLERSDANRLELISGYVGRGQFDTAQLVLNATYLIASLWRSHVDYVKMSMKQY